MITIANLNWLLDDCWNKIGEAEADTENNIPLYFFLFGQNLKEVLASTIIPQHRQVVKDFVASHGKEVVGKVSIEQV